MSASSHSVGKKKNLIEEELEEENVIFKACPSYRGI
jgi:hypothetical protein